MDKDLYTKLRRLEARVSNLEGLIQEFSNYFSTFESNYMSDRCENERKLKDFGELILSQVKSITDACVEEKNITNNKQGEDNV